MDGCVSEEKSENDEATTSGGGANNKARLEAAPLRLLLNIFSEMLEMDAGFKVPRTVLDSLFESWSAANRRTLYRPVVNILLRERRLWLPRHVLLLLPELQLIMATPWIPPFTHSLE